MTQQPNHRTADLTIRSGIWRGGASWLAAALAIGLLASSAPAQTVPLPKPAPKARDNMQMTASEKSPATTATATAKPPEPVIPDPRRNVPASLFATFDANQKAQAAKVSNYLSSLNTLVGNFVQVGPDGSRSKGDFYIQKPGKLRFEYDAPSTIAMIADGSSVAVRDRKLATQDIYPLSQTPLRYLLSDRIDLMRDTNVVNVTADDVFISVTVEEKSALIGTSRLMLMLGAKDNQLKQWTVTDPQATTPPSRSIIWIPRRSRIRTSSRSTTPPIRPAARTNPAASVRRSSPGIPHGRADSSAFIVASSTEMGV